MLTGDENIVKLEVHRAVQRCGADATGTSDFLFNVRDAEGAVRAAAEAGMREVIGRTAIDQVLTEGKEQVQVEAQQLLQSILDRDGAGIEVVTVKVQDVDPPDRGVRCLQYVISAQQDKEAPDQRGSRLCEMHAVLRACGQAAQTVNEAEAYRETKVREATGHGAALRQAAGGVRQGEGRDPLLALPRATMAIFLRQQDRDGRPQRQQTCLTCCSSSSLRGVSRRRPRSRAERADDAGIVAGSGLPRDGLLVAGVEPGASKSLQWMQAMVAQLGEPGARGRVGARAVLEDPVRSIQQRPTRSPASPPTTLRPRTS